MIQSKKHFEKILRCPYAEILEIATEMDKYYREKKVVKKDKQGNAKRDKDGNPKYRIMYPSVGRLKTIQSKIKNSILRKIPLPENAYGGVKGKDSVMNAKVHQGRKYKFCTDIKRFFPSITSQRVYETYIEQGFSADIASILTKLCTYKYQVPQGTPTSTHLANLIFLNIDQELIKLCKERNIRYTRYVDDLSFSSQKPFKEDTYEIIKIIEKQGFIISHRKTRYAEGCVVVTGVWVKNNSLDVTKEFKYKLDHPEKFKSNQVVGHNAFYNRVKNISS